MLVKSFARIHRANLINAGILPLEFENENDYANIALGDNLAIEKVREQIAAGDTIVILAGGLLNYTISK